MSTTIERLTNGSHPSADELRPIPTFNDLAPEDLAWLAERMHVADLSAGEIAVQAGDPADWMLVLLTGELRIDRADGGLYVASAGDVTGLLPYSRLTHFPSAVRAGAATRIAGLHRDHFAAMHARIPALQGRLVNLMADRIRQPTAAFQQQEKLSALGKLSAGLAHELNNPASAARRAADNLRAALSSVRSAALQLDRQGLPQESRVFLAQLECDWASQAGPQSALDSLERSDREEELTAWLAENHVPSGPDLAMSLVDLGCTRQTLDLVRQNVPAQFLPFVLVRLTAAFTISRLADEISGSTARISELVQAIKDYSYMDQMPEQQVDIHRGIESTLVMLRHRFKHGIEVVRDYDRSLPEIRTRGSELNQVWTNLIVNAADAMGERGKLTIRTLRDGACARVEVIDTGSGIPESVQSRVFEPFFTTKPVGEGTGLGLDIVYRIVKNQHGDVTFDSKPGHTRFVVRLPFTQPSKSRDNELASSVA